MKRIFSITLVLMMLISMSVTAFAAEGVTIDVAAKYEETISGIYEAEVKDGTAGVEITGGIRITVSGASNSITSIEIFPIPASDTEAVAWMNSKIADHGTLSHGYMINLVDENGNKTSANGVQVTITCSHCGGDEILLGLNPNGNAKTISTTNGSFTANGSTYYIIAEKKSDATTITVPVRGDENEIHADVTLDGDTVELHELDFAEIDHIVGDKDKDGLIEIDLTELDEKITKIELPMASIKHIVEAAEETHNEHEHLQIDFPHGSVTMDDKTLRAITDTVGEETTVDLVLESVGTDRLNDTQDKALEGAKIYGGYEAYLICNNTGVRVSDFKGGVATLSVPFEIPNGLKAEKFAVWYVADDGKTEKLETWHEDGKLHWSVGHFSDFIIVYEEPQDNDGGNGDNNDNDQTPGSDNENTPSTENTPAPEDSSTSIQSPPTGDSSNLLLWIALLLGSCFVLLILKRKKKAE